MSFRDTIAAVFQLQLLATVAAVFPMFLSAQEHVVFKNGFDLECAWHETQQDTGKVRIYASPHDLTPSSGSSSYLEVEVSSIRLIEEVEPATMMTAPDLPVDHRVPGSIRGLLADAGLLHHIDVDLLASLVNAESGGHAGAVSRVGARGLMQLMPATAASFGVQNPLVPEQNVAGGTAYLDQLLTRFHEDISLALAAYNAGPGAVDRWHGIPPYRETRLYVARVLSEYNRRKRAGVAGPATH